MFRRLCAAVVLIAIAAPAASGQVDCRKIKPRPKYDALTDSTVLAMDEMMISGGVPGNTEFFGTYYWARAFIAAPGKTLGPDARWTLEAKAQIPQKTAAAAANAVARFPSPSKVVLLAGDAKRFQLGEASPSTQSENSFLTGPQRVETIRIPIDSVALWTVADEGKGTLGVGPVRLDLHKRWVGRLWQLLDAAACFVEKAPADSVAQKP